MACGALMPLLHVLLIPHVIVLKIRKLTQKFSKLPHTTSP